MVSLQSEAFWLDSPGSLLSNMHVVPTCEMSKEGRLNAITRLLIIVTVVLFFLVKSSMWLTVLVAGIAVVLVIYFFNVKRRQGFRSQVLVPVAPATAAVLNAPRALRSGSIGYETKVIPRTTISNATGFKPTTTFRKR